MVRGDTKPWNGIEPPVCRWACRRPADGRRAPGSRI